MPILLTCPVEACGHTEKVTDPMTEHMDTAHPGVHLAAKVEFVKHRNVTDHYLLRCRGCATLMEGNGPPPRLCPTCAEAATV